VSEDAQRVLPFAAVAHSVGGGPAAGCGRQAGLSDVPAGGESCGSDAETGEYSRVGVAFHRRLPPLPQHTLLSCGTPDLLLLRSVHLLPELLHPAAAAVRLFHLVYPMQFRATSRSIAVCFGEKVSPSISTFSSYCMVLRAKTSIGSSRVLISLIAGSPWVR